MVLGVTHGATPVTITAITAPYVDQNISHGVRSTKAGVTLRANLLPTNTIVLKNDQLWQLE